MRKSSGRKPRVAVLTTGVMELAALHLALSRRFPQAEFVPQAAAAGRPYDSFTSGALPAPPTKAHTAAVRIAQAAAQLADDASVHLVLILDDLELDHVHKPGEVIRAVRQAFLEHLGMFAGRSGILAGDVEDLRRALREKVSFHLAAPMIEAWLFADPHGPARAGVPAHRLPVARCDTDPEMFCFVDPAYVADQGAECDRWFGLSEERRKKHPPLWLKPNVGRLRCCHPKAAMAWLCRDPNADTCTSYRETGSGKDALEKLDWDAVLAAPRRCLWLRALHNDLACALGAPPSFGEEAQLTRMKAGVRDRVLRNL